MRRVILFVVALTVSGSSLLLAEESLGDVAAREKERRKGQTGSKVITETELTAAKGRSVSADGSTPSDSPATDEKKPASPASPASPAEKTDDQIRAEKENDWRTRKDAAAAEVTRLQDLVSQLEQTANEYSSPLLLNHLEEARKALSAAQATAANLEDERRFAGYK